jgi:FkbM family methyltransferase
LPDIDREIRPTELVETPIGRYETFTADLITRQLKRFGGHQRPDLAMAKSQLRAGDVVLDVGAHIGTFSIPFAFAVQPGGRVYAFEPVPETVELLRRNVGINAAPVTAVHAVVADAHVAMRGIDVSGNTQGTWFEEAASDDSVAVAPTIILDEWYAAQEIPGALGLLKVDVEGMELRVLRGAHRLISAQHPAIMAEVSRGQLARVEATLAELDAFFSEHDYHLFMNLSARNAHDDEFTLGRLPAVRLLRMGGSSLGLVDVLAVHSESDRYPNSAAGSGSTLARVAFAGGRAVIRRGSRLVKGRKPSS